jgi:hypothetical protein
VTQEKLQRGTIEFDEAIFDICEYYCASEDAILGLIRAVESTLQKLLAEQAVWFEDEKAEMTNLIKSFSEDEAKERDLRGRLFVMSHLWGAKIRAEASLEHFGYCLFHEQGLDRCIESYGLVLRHEVIGDEWVDTRKHEELAKLLVTTVQDTGLKFEWNGDINRVIELPVSKGGCAYMSVVKMSTSMMKRTRKVMKSEEG